MAAGGFVGARIRARRMEMGRSQQDLAKAAGISSSYLNLIEHDKRRIAGTVLGDVAKALEVDPSVLTAPVDTAKLGAVSAAAGEATEAPDAFVQRFPGWANVVADQAGKIARLEAQVATLTDRMAHDPTLAGALHQVVSTVTSIRSTASILVEGAGDRDWEARFHQNIHGDSLRLAEVTQSLVSYLEGAPDAAPLSAQEEALAFCDARGHFFEEIERGEKVRLDGLSEGVARIVDAWLRGYAEDADALPLGAFVDVAMEMGFDPAALAVRFDQPLDRVMRRLASLPVREGQPAMGLAVCDGAGAVTHLKRVSGFDMALTGGGCALWPLYTALGQVGRPLKQVVVMPDEGAPRLTCYAVAQAKGPVGFDMPAHVEAVMLVVADAPEAVPREVGAGCAVCPREDCAARRIA